MNNQKMENLLNLALDASDREREKSPELSAGSAVWMTNGRLLYVMPAVLTFSLPIPRFFFLEIMQFLRLRKKKSKSSLR